MSNPRSAWHEIVERPVGYHEFVRPRRRKKREKEAVIASRREGGREGGGDLNMQRSITSAAGEGKEDLLSAEKEKTCRLDEFQCLAGLPQSKLFIFSRKGGE